MPGQHFIFFIDNIFELALGVAQSRGLRTVRFHDNER
jgi:CRISPR/Cas system CSM-associated protein Csm3 (group 7 of RAMP superfamily)